MSFQRICPIPEPCETFCNKLIFYGEDFLASPYWLSITAYSIYLQLPYISGGHILHLQPENMPGCGERDQHNMEKCGMSYKRM
jgi:hypothetical protein